MEIETKTKPEPAPKPTILFDIDGTLIQTRGAGRSAIDQTLLDMFGIDNQFQVTLAGRTDYAILGDIFAANQLDFATHYAEFSARYHDQLEATLSEIDGGVLPGVIDLLQRLQADDYSMGIITGNGRIPAWHKLRRFGLDSYFAFGGYGDDSADRNVVADQAIRAAKQELQSAFRIEDCWVIGDTPADATCAQSVGAKSLVVLTGGYDRNDFDDFDVFEILQDLTQLGPDFFR